MSDHDTLRWGDTQSLNLAAAALIVEGMPIVLTSKQMLNAKWERPVVWRLMLTVAVQVGADDTGLTFDVLINVQVGVGGVNQLVPLVVIPFATPFNPSIQFFDIPAEAMQVQFQVGNLVGTVLDPTGDIVTVTAMCAPHAEPGAIAQMRSAMHAPTHVTSPDSEGLPRWMGTPHPDYEPDMPQGFDDGQLRYRR